MRESNSEGMGVCESIEPIGRDVEDGWCWVGGTEGYCAKPFEGIEPPGRPCGMRLFELMGRIPSCCVFDIPNGRGAPGADAGNCCGGMPCLPAMDTFPRWSCKFFLYTSSKGKRMAI